MYAYPPTFYIPHSVFLLFEGLFLHLELSLSQFPSTFAKASADKQLVRHSSPPSSAQCMSGAGSVDIPADRSWFVTSSRIRCLSAAASHSSFFGTQAVVLGALLGVAEREE